MTNLSEKILELSSDVYVIPGNTNVGVIISREKTDNEVFLVDSGCTEIEGEYVLDVLKAFFQQLEQSFVLKGIFTTHAHADHCGGHNFLKQETGCTIYASRHEQGCMETPMIQPTNLWGGYPPHELRTLYFKPEETFVDENISQDSVFTISNNRTITFMELHGHSHCALAVIVTSENGKKTIFTGDGVFPKDEIGRHWIPLIINPSEYMESLDNLCNIQNVEWCIPSHGNFLKKNIAEAAELNKIAIISTRMCIMEALKTHKKMTVEEIVKYVADKNNMNMAVSQYVLICSTVRSYLSIMHDAKEIKMKVERNILYFYIDEVK